MWYSRTMEDYSTIKRNGVLIHGTRYVNFDIITQSERTPHKRVHRGWFYLNEMLRLGKHRGTK